jgi:hypothetical protein
VPALPREQEARHPAAHAGYAAAREREAVPAARRLGVAEAEPAAGLVVGPVGAGLDLEGADQELADLAQALRVGSDAEAGRAQTRRGEDPAAHRLRDGRRLVDGAVRHAARDGGVERVAGDGEGPGELHPRHRPRPDAVGVEGALREREDLRRVPHLPSPEVEVLEERALPDDDLAEDRIGGRQQAPGVDVQRHREIAVDAEAPRLRVVRARGGDAGGDGHQDGRAQAGRPRRGHRVRPAGVPSACRQEGRRGEPERPLEAGREEMPAAERLAVEFRAAGMGCHARSPGCSARGRRAREDPIRADGLLSSVTSNLPDPAVSTFDLAQCRGYSA